jgi:hypothetical protein
LGFAGINERLDKEHQRLMNQLSKLKGADYEKAIDQFDREAKNSRDPAVEAFAEKWLPTLREHLQLARTTVKDLK